MSEVYLQRDLPRKAEECIQIANEMIEAHGELVCRPEVLGQEGKLRLAEGARDEAERLFSQAIEEARGQQARVLEWSLTLSLHRLLSEDDRTPEARLCLQRALEYEYAEHEPTSPELTELRELFAQEPS